MNCKNCGAPLDEGSRFCTVCGTKNEPVQENNAARPAPYAPPVDDAFSANQPNNTGYDPWAGGGNNAQRNEPPSNNAWNENPNNNAQWNGYNQPQPGPHNEHQHHSGGGRRGQTITNSATTTAVAGFIMSVVSVFVFWWLGIAGIISGISGIGLTLKAKKEGGKRWIIYLVLNILSIIIGAVGVILYWNIIT